MGMHKIFVGTIVFFSLAFLAACGGGSGSAGSTGATGATGDAGAKGDTGLTGSIAVPTVTATIAWDNDTTIEDTDYRLETFTSAQSITVTLDNVTDARSKLRYRTYWASGTTSSDIIDEALVGVGSITGGHISTFTRGTGWTDNIMDPRRLATGKYVAAYGTLDSTDKFNSKTAYLQVYSGNEAGDQTTPATLLMRDAGVTFANAGGTSGDLTADNSTMGMVVPTGSANAFQMFHTNAEATGVIAEALTDVKGSAVTADGASAAHSSTAVVLAMAAIGTSDAVYVLVQDNLTTDNGTFYYRTATSGNLASGTGKLNDTKPILKGAILVPVSSTKGYAVWARSSMDNETDTRVYASLLTLSAGTVTVSNIADYVQSFSNSDNTSQKSGLAIGQPSLPSAFPICAAGRAESITGGGYAKGDTTTHLAVGYADNATQDTVGGNWMISFTSDNDNFSYRTALDTNINTAMGDSVATQVCGMAWAEGTVNTTTAHDNGTLWFAANNGPTGGGSSDNLSLQYSTLFDNATFGAWTQAGGGIAMGESINQIEIAYDYKYRPYVATLLDNGSVMVSWSADGTALVHYAGGGANSGAIADSDKPISFVRSADGKQLALSYHTATGTGGTDMKVVVIYADGTSM